MSSIPTPSPKYLQSLEYLRGKFQYQPTAIAFAAFVPCPVISWLLFFWALVNFQTYSPLLLLCCLPASVSSGETKNNKAEGNTGMNPEATPVSRSAKRLLACPVLVFYAPSVYVVYFIGHFCEDPNAPWTLPSPEDVAWLGFPLSRTNLDQEILRSLRCHASNPGDLFTEDQTSPATPANPSNHTFPFPWLHLLFRQSHSQPLASIFRGGDCEWAENRVGTTGALGPMVAEGYHGLMGCVWTATCLLFDGAAQHAPTTPPKYAAHNRSRNYRTIQATRERRAEKTEKIPSSVLRGGWLGEEGAKTDGHPRVRREPQPCNATTTRRELSPNFP
ncbi:hypothetical protein SODALDRAFT_377896 [Sodiomyces alkalinus F11]|uniref:Uncharacterized protein n=1 Tax=Sodiomyces alkalinus (strain CBS 110278 / VKM F-3762 / F11) TaxID=1314773 RepID=A0A3N2PZT0_SODAK|nr:hypothetical protein SODALDRAFT_377896 [Sodiomyces alkalinus F11]ROT40007.1 hypothetical protein SODALDRAFT_377896 [Sodiomyces alkalinus F11]